MIIRLHLFTTNAYLIQTEQGPFLVDSGLPRDWSRLLKLIRSHGVEPSALRAVLHTHAHSDHVGCSAALRREYNIPLVLHREELKRAASGQNGPLNSASWMSPVARPFVVEHFPAFEPDLVLDNNLDLEFLGFPGTVLRTPGHTSGSLSYILGKEAIVGDILRGSLQPWKRGGATHFFHEDRAAAEQSVSSVLAQGVTKLHPGHFKTIILPDKNH